tara:strand:+ start:2156 stop:2437 length:282 start_codon:yes stop_codon:yes gene_type:complete
MGIPNEGDWAIAYRRENGFKHLSEEVKDLAQARHSKTVRSTVEKVKHCRIPGQHHNRTTKSMTSRGIKRTMARVDKAKQPNARQRRPRNGFAD